MRGVAIVLMIGTHATDAFLADAWKHNEVWYTINILFGFVAPAYMYFSGTTLWVALQRRGDDPFTLGPKTRHLLRRFALIILLGYWLQIPVLSLRQLVWIQRPHELERLFNSNVLQVIGLTLLAITLVAYLLGSLHRTRIAALAVSIVIVIVTPWILQSGLYLSVPLPLRYYLAPQPPAIFAIVPHAAYVLLGFATASPLIDAVGRRRGWLSIAVAGIALLAGAWLLDMLLADVSPFNQFWGSTPQQFIFRMGGLAVITAAVATVAGGTRPHSTAWLEFAGRRSLGVYMLHLMLIYGSVMTMGIRYWLHGALNNTMSPIATAAATVAIMAITWFALRIWEWLRTTYPPVALWSKRGWWGVFWALFLLKP
jgi:peptidoglycan/LPS O-acetylase OafA/YrhL